MLATRNDCIYPLTTASKSIFELYLLFHKVQENGWLPHFISICSCAKNDVSWANLEDIECWYWNHFVVVLSIVIRDLVIVHRLKRIKQDITSIFILQCYAFRLWSVFKWFKTNIPRILIIQLASESAGVKHWQQTVQKKCSE